MSNKVIHISASEVDKVRKELEADNMLIAEIDGSKCPDLTEYLHIISDIMTFPMCPRGLDSYNDWICDLTWLAADKKIAIIIKYFSQFLSNDVVSKTYVMEDFEKMILPWWESDVMKYVVEGKPRTFLVYLVD